MAVMLSPGDTVCARDYRMIAFTGPELLNVQVTDVMALNFAVVVWVSARLRGAARPIALLVGGRVLWSFEHSVRPSSPAWDPW